MLKVVVTVATSYAQSLPLFWLGLPALSGAHQKAHGKGV